ncbi:MAG TPA: M23 family metallopeptidase [Candidatus Anaerofilum faecale]|nr:M23 family metallopeptidase [Anaerofilum sp. An201]OUP03864.1 hypothetical protein B5F36_07560 [Anaerofilum sp. An201]HIX13747.1 M23 family metallopeptidase [Candidatus Anaerofilum faecale]
MNNRSNPLVSFLRGKGFYLVLAGCILAAAACSFVAIRNMMTELNENAGQTPQEGDAEWDLDIDLPDTPVEQKADSVPVPSTPVPSPAASSSGSSSAQSQQAPSSGSSAPEEPADVPAQSYVRPVPGQTSLAYSGDELIFNETLGDWRTHNGADLAAAAGDEVKSVMAGTVAKAEEDGNWGGVVEVDCGGIVLRYAGLQLPLQVAAGDTLEAGQTLGLVGEVPCESVADSHLHFEALADGQYVDPAPYLP